MLIDMPDFHVWNCQLHIDFAVFLILFSFLEITCKKKKIPQIILGGVDVGIGDVFMDWFDNCTSCNQGFDFLTDR